jgi:intracellular sulfur oxidation DsrE/DsrF family protein
LPQGTERNHRNQTSEKIMTAIIRATIVAFAIGLLATGGVHAQSGKPHRIAIQVDQNDPAVMNLALNNAENVMEYYRGKGEDVEIEIVAYGPGLNMLRADTSPVKARIAQIANADASFPAKIAFSACNNTLQSMEKREGHAITVIPQAKIVPAGIVRLTELEEHGWSYIRP